MAAITPDPLIGRIIDNKYQIAERIGAGGMGAVYRAIHVSLGALRAIKVMKRELLEDPGFVERFQNEARMAEGLRHANLVALYDFACLEDGSWYIVSEYVQGDTMAALLKRGVRFQSADVAALLGQICDGLALAHRKGIVHRDISPDNIMITRGEAKEPIAKLLDFGIAKQVGDSSGQTGSGMLLGKIGYSSPEQMGLIPKGERIDGRADVFSLSALGFEMLAGRLPWRKDALQSYVHDLLVRPEHVLLDEIDRSVAPEWRDVFKRGLARQRERRTPSVQALRAEMIEAARRVADAERGQPATRTMAATLKPTDTTWRKVAPPEKPRSRAPLWAALGVVAALAIGVALVLSRTQAPARETAPSAATTIAPAPIPSADLPTTEPEPSTPPSTTAGAPPVSVESARPDAVVSAEPLASSSRRPATRQTRPSPVASSAPPPSPRAAASPAPETPTPPPPAQVGALVVKASPDASVLLDGQQRGRTPVTLENLPAGRHTLVLLADDGRRLQEELVIPAGESIERSVRFPGFGSLSVTSDIWVEVSVDGSPPQQTPLRIDRLPAGPHTVRASRPGYKEHVYRVEIKEADTYLLKVALEKQ